jgi:hypothetical protein
MSKTPPPKAQIQDEEAFAELSKEKEEQALYLTPSSPKPRPTSPPFTRTSVFNPKKDRSRFNEILSTAPPTPSPNKSSSPPFKPTYRLLRSARPMKPDIIYPQDDD